MKGDLEAHRDARCVSFNERPHGASARARAFYPSSFSFHPSSFILHPLPSRRPSCTPRPSRRRSSPEAPPPTRSPSKAASPDGAPQLQLPAGLDSDGQWPLLQQPDQHHQWRRRVTAPSSPGSSSRARPAPSSSHRRRSTSAAEPYKSNEVRVVANANAVQPASQNDPLLVIQIEKREIYVGEVVPITVTVYAPDRRVAIQRIGLIEVPKDNFAIQRFPLQPEQTIVSMGGARYRAYVFRSTLSALKPGKFKLGPATSEILFEVEARGSAGGGMQHPFFTQMEQRTARPQSSDIEMTVLPLPETGRPPASRGSSAISTSPSTPSPTNSRWAIRSPSR